MKSHELWFILLLAVATVDELSIWLAYQTDPNRWRLNEGLGGSSLCFVNQDCIGGLFNLDNYCCRKSYVGLCCDYVEYVFSDPARTLKNFVTTFKEPRMINLFVITLIFHLLGVF